MHTTLKIVCFYSNWYKIFGSFNMITFGDIGRKFAALMAAKIYQGMWTTKWHLTWLLDLVLTMTVKMMTVRRTSCEGALWHLKYSQNTKNIIGRFAAKDLCMKISSKRNIRSLITSIITGISMIILENINYCKWHKHNNYHHYCHLCYTIITDHQYHYHYHSNIISNHHHNHHHHHHESSRSLLLIIIRYIIIIIIIIIKSS